MNVIEFLESHYQSFLGWQCSGPSTAPAQEYDSAIYKMRDLLRKDSLVGYHCTKLTAGEVKSIRDEGMLLQNSTSLRERISRIKEDGLISADVARSLISKNQSDDNNRANMLWFCFYEPYLAGRYGIERFFRSWGGEALYNYHEDHPVTGKALQSIGIPCVIKAKVPIASLKSSYYPDNAMIRVFLSQRGYQLENGIEHEGFSTNKIDPQDIIDIFEYPSDQFIELTKFDTWEGYDAVS